MINHAKPFPFNARITFGGQVGDKETTLECFREAWKHGINFFDTAEVYCSGQAELALGIVFKELEWERSDFVVCTKLYWGGSGPNDKGLSRKHIFEGMQKSLGRLQLEYVDVVMAHRYDLATPIEEIVRAFSDLITRGKALYWGTSEWSAAQIESACQTAARLGLIAPICDQTQYNLLHRQRVEQEYRDGLLYDKYKYGLTTWSPLASGILSGKYNDLIVPEGSRLAFTENRTARGFREKLSTPEGRAEIERVENAGQIASQLGCTMAQFAIAWCLKNENVSTVITGASRPEQIAENVKAVHIVDKITPELMAKADAIMGNKPDGPQYYSRDV